MSPRDILTTNSHQLFSKHFEPRRKSTPTQTPISALLPPPFNFFTMWQSHTTSFLHLLFHLYESPHQALPHLLPSQSLKLVYFTIPSLIFKNLHNYSQITRTPSLRRLSSFSLFGFLWFCTIHYITSRLPSQYLGSSKNFRIINMDL